MTGPSLTSLSCQCDPRLFHANHPYPTAMSGRRCSSSNCPEVILFMCLTLHPQRCTSLPTSLFQPCAHGGRRLDLGCGEHTLTTHFFFWLLPYPTGSGYWILECAKQWRVSCPSTLTEAGAQSKLAIVTVGSPELRVRWRVHAPYRANHSSHLAQASIWCLCTLICPFFALPI